MSDEQKGLWEIEIEDPELEAACDVIARSKEQRKQQRAAAGLRREKARALEARIRDTIGEEQFLSTGCRIRVGRYVIKVGQRSGGNFSVPAWTSVGVLAQEIAE